MLARTRHKSNSCSRPLRLGCRHISILKRGLASSGYDAGGNRTYSSLNGALRNHLLDAGSNRLLAVTNPPLGYSFDAAGNVTGLGNAVASYDLTGRWASMLSGALTTSFTYNAQGQRVRKYSSTGATSTTIFAYDQSGQLLGEYASTGAAIREYVWLGTMPVALFTPDPVAANPPIAYFIDTDHLNTPRAVTDRNNALRWSWLAEPFGTDAPATSPQGLEAMNLPLRFAGQYDDAESGLFYNYFRDYDPWAGRYSQSDPIGLAGGLNTYSYVRGNPLSRVDPLGLNDLDITDGSEVPAGEFQSTNPLPNMFRPSDKAACVAKCIAGKAATGAGIAALGYGALEVAARTGAMSPLATVGLVSVYKQYGKYYSTGKMALNLQQCTSECEEDQCKK